MNKALAVHESFGDKMIGLPDSLTGFFHGSSMNEAFVITTEIMRKSGNVDGEILPTCS